jgi:hypothetical protein
MKKKTPRPSRDRNALLGLRAHRDYLHKQVLNLQTQLNDQLGFAIAPEIWRGQPGKRWLARCRYGRHYPKGYAFT